jgi:hypothetical protein
VKSQRSRFHFQRAHVLGAGALSLDACGGKEINYSLYAKIAQSQGQLHITGVFTSCLHTTLHKTWQSTFSV